MANAYGLFWNSEDGDRTYNADSFAEWLRKFFTTGVFANELVTTATTGMGISVSAGYANINGKVRFFDQATAFTLSAANSTYPRIDNVVIERNDTNREITMKIVEGSYSGNTPVAPTPTRTASVYQIVIAQVYVGAGATDITQANITDTRADTTLCGYVTGTVSEIDWDEITAQFEAYFAEFQEENLDEFLEWFEHIKDQLDEDAAGHLQNEIDAIVQESCFKVVEENGVLKLYWYGAQETCPYSIEYEDGVYNLYFNYTTT